MFDEETSASISHRWYFLIPYIATAQRSWIPYTAQVETTSVSATKRTNTTVGMHYRDSAGDVYTTEFAPGTQTVVHSSLYDATHKVRHVLDGDTKRALGTAQIMGRFKPPSELVLGQEILDGNATTIYPIRIPGQAVNVGKAWVIDGTDIIVKTYSTLQTEALTK